MGEFFDKTKGKVKQAVGDLTNNPKLRREGVADETKGKIEGAVKDVNKAIKEITR